MGRTRVGRLLRLFTAMLVVALAAGCSVTTSGTLRTTVTPTPTPTPIPFPSPVPTPSPFPTPTPFPTPFPTPTPTPTSTPTPTPTPTPALFPASRFIFGTPGFESGSIQAGMINSDASVSPVAGSPFNENLGSPSIIQIVPDPKGRFLYVLNVSASAAGGIIGQAGIGGFGINSVTGALTRVPGSPLVFSSDNGNLMAIDGTGQFLFEPNGFVGSPGTGFNVYAIDQSTGALTLTSATSNTSPIGSFTLASADGRFVFNAGNGLVEVFTISVPTGQLSVVPGTPTSTLGSAGPMAASADGRFLYVANQAQGTIAVFSIGATGALTLVSGSPFPIDTGAQFLTLTPNGTFLYVAATPNGGAGATIKGYAVNPFAGTFTPVAGAALSNLTTVTMDRSGSFVYISRVGQLSTFTIDPVTGALALRTQTTAPSSDNPNDVVVVP